MKKLTPKQYARALMDAAQAVPAKDQAEVFRNFLAALRRQRALRLLPRIMSHIQALDDTAHGLTRIVVRAADAATLAQVSEALGGKKVAVQSEIDPSLKAGVQLRVGDRLIDASLRTQLQRLRHHLATT